MKPVRLIILIALLVKVCYILFAMGMARISVGLPEISSSSDVLSISKKNDANWYEAIATHGHSKTTPDKLGACEEGNQQQSYYAFFPLYPAILGLTMKLSGLAFDAVAFLFSVIFSLLLFVFFFRYAESFLGSGKTALFATLILMLSPFHYYFSMYYTEALFLLLLVISFYCIDKNKLLLFALASSLLVLVRPNGLFLLLPLFIHFLGKTQALELWRPFRLKPKEFSFVVYFIPAVLTFVAYCVYLRYMTGDFFAFKTAQIGWCHHTVFPWQPLLTADSPADYFKCGWLFLFGMIGLWHVRKIPFSFFVLTCICLLLPLVANSITAPRYISVIFVFPLIFSGWISSGRTPKHLVIFLILFALQLWTFSFWISEDELSY